MPEALYRRQGDLYHPGPTTEGPWSPHAQHGGPPAALMAGAIEKHPSEGPMLLARITIELLRPVPLKPLSLAVSTVRPGKKVQLVSASLTHDGSEVARALGLRIRQADVEAGFPLLERAIPALPDGNAANFFPNPGAFAIEAVEIRMVAGDFNVAGPGQAWLRLKVPLIKGEETSVVEKVAAVSDFGNGISNLAGDVRNWVFINPDLELRMFREPSGEWFYLDSETRVSETGMGIATSTVGDEHGWLGVAAQSLFVDHAASGSTSPLLPGNSVERGSAPD